ncbi:MAG: PilZ domain-containing protein [Sedimentisphaerales bacterium]|nr:PilZ domain-containing protein [Sedimentisphaerales bacterium]
MFDNTANRCVVTSTQRRRHFRITYPESSRPWLITHSKRRFRIHDISEEGIRFLYRSADSQTIPLVFGAKVMLLCGEEVSVSGKIIRMEPDLAVLQLEVGIPYKVIHNEELYLIRRFKGKVRESRRRRGFRC